jgi:hypothetical protein
MRRNNAAQALYRLIYCSRDVAGPAGDAAHPDLDAIAAGSRRRNEQEGVTGALLFTGTGYAHVLEGPRDALDRVFDRVAADPRHTEVTILSFTPTERRRFPDQPMTVLAALPPGMVDPLGGLRPDPEHDRPRITTGGDLLRLIETLARMEREVVA